MAGPLTTNPLVATDTSENFVAINLDVDAFAANFFAPIAALSVPIGFLVPLIAATVSGSVVPFDADVTGGLNLSQDLSMQVVGLTGKLTYEDDTFQTFDFGTPFTLDNALTKDANGDKQIDFNLTITPNVTLANDTDININLGLSLELFKFTGTFSPLVGEDATIDEAPRGFRRRI